MDTSKRVDKSMQLQELEEEITQIERENRKDQSVIERVQKIVEKSSKLVEKSDSTSAMIIDAKILNTGSQVVRKIVTAFDPNLTAFDEREYCKGILNYLENNTNRFTEKNQWKCLAPVTYNLFAKSTPVKSILGSITLEQLPVKERRKAERLKKTIKEKTKLADASTTKSPKGKMDSDKDIYEHILKSLVRCYRENQKKPVLFLNFIMNPDSYWQTIQNIFYFSFLVKDGQIKMSLNDDDLPVVEPVHKRKDAQADSQVEEADNRKQFSFSLSKKDWSTCIHKLNITSPKIEAFKKS